MAGANLQIVVQAKDQASSVIAGISKPIGGLVSSLGAIGLAGLGIDTISTAFHGFIDASLEAQNVQTQLNSVLASTKGVSGMTAASVNALSDSLSKVTPFEDEAIGSAQNLLLTFTNIGKDVFPQATEAILNMSQSLGQDLKSSSIQLGKALNDPIKGITALSRVGVSFTGAQKSAIKEMIKMGNVAGAQGIILGELNVEFGNSAKAAGQTFAGKLAILNTQIGNVKEAIGGPLLSVLGDLMTQLQPIINAFVDNLPGALDKAGHAFQGLKDAISDLLAGKGMDQAFADFNDLFVEAFDISPADLLGQLGNVGTNVLNWIKGEIPIVAAQLLTWGRAFVDWVSPMIPPLLAKLGELATQAWAWIQQQAPIVVDKLKAWGQSFIDWISPMIPPFLAQMGTLATQLWQWIQDQAQPLIDKLGVWKDQFVAWIPGAVTSFLAAWPAQFDKFLDWIGDQAKPILSKLGAWAGAFIGWIVPMIPTLTTALLYISLAVLEFIGLTIYTLGNKLLAWGKAFIEWIVPMLPGLGTELGKIDKAMKDWLDSETVILGNLAYDWGAHLIQRFLDGFRSQSLADAIAQINITAPGTNQIFSAPTSGPFAPAPTAAPVGDVSGYSATSGGVHVHIYGSQSNPAQIQSAATTGVLAAQRSLGY